VKGDDRLASVPVGRDASIPFCILNLSSLLSEKGGKKEDGDRLAGPWAPLRS